MKIKYEDLEKIFKKLSVHSQKGDIEVSIDGRTHALVFNYSSNLNTDTTLTAYPTELNKFVTINEEQWLK